MTRLFRLNLEEMEGRWIAFIAELPGCFASDADQSAALAKVPPAMADYFAWLRAHGEAIPDELIQTQVDEIHRAWNSETDYEVNAFFAVDRPPLTPDEIARALRLLEWSRADLLTSVEGLSPDVLARPVEGEWSILGILNHVGRAEWWYLDRLSQSFPREELPQDLFSRLEKIRAHFRMILPMLAGDERLTEPAHERWSPRKMLRRALWHERDHTDHILQFRRRLV
ncbi:MAG: DinB family protein [Chloroflexota bacterium]